jgi:DNA (cytosine-5)-methyltransferase 1
MNTLTSGDRHGCPRRTYRVSTRHNGGSSGGDGGVPSSRGEHLVVEPNVAIPIDTRNALRDPNKYDAQNRQGLGIGADGDPMATLTSAHVNGVAAGTATMVVRRLTPLECERLMGWPDDHTRYKADGTEQADTHRYKQCGNGVASPVAEWIGEQLRNL